MEQLAKKAVEGPGIEAQVEKVSDIREIMAYTISTPWLLVNGRLKHSGKPLPNLKRVKVMIREGA